MFPLSATTPWNCNNNRQTKGKIAMQWNVKQKQPHTKKREINRKLIDKKTKPFTIYSLSCINSCMTPAKTMDVPFSYWGHHSIVEYCALIRFHHWRWSRTRVVSRQTCTNSVPNIEGTPLQVSWPVVPSTWPCTVSVPNFWFELCKQQKVSGTVSSNCSKESSTRFSA